MYTVGKDRNDLFQHTAQSTTHHFPTDEAFKKATIWREYAPRRILFLWKSIDYPQANLTTGFVTFMASMTSLT